MWRSLWLVLGLVVAAAGGQCAAAEQMPVAGMIETTLATASNQIRQFAFDGDPNTFFLSQQNPSSSDHFTFVLDGPVAVQSIAVNTAGPDGGKLQAGALEVSADGKSFEPVATFTDGAARAMLAGRKIRAIRIQPTADAQHALAISELVIEADPPVAVFKYPVEIIVNVDDAPEMQEWAEKTARICERAYPMINEELKSDGFKPPHVVTMTLKNDYRGVAATSGARITGSVGYFKSHANDVGAMVHETVHVVQRYRSRNNPGWLVEGVADYVRFFKFEPGKLGRIDANRAHYNGSYRTTAAFLAYLTEKYDSATVLKLNRAMRAGEYREELFEDLTGKTVQQLDEEWRATLGR